MATELIIGETNAIACNSKSIKQKLILQKIEIKGDTSKIAVSFFLYLY